MPSGTRGVLNDAGVELLIYWGRMDPTTSRLASHAKELDASRPHSLDLPG